MSTRGGIFERLLLTLAYVWSLRCVNFTRNSYCSTDKWHSKVHSGLYEIRTVILLDAHVEGQILGTKGTIGVKRVLAFLD